MTNTARHHLTYGIKNKNKNKGVQLRNIEKGLPGVGGWGKQKEVGKRVQTNFQL